MQRIGLLGELADHRLVTEMHAVEIADCRHASVVTRIKIMQPADEFHGQGTANKPSSAARPVGVELFHYFRERSATSVAFVVGVVVANAQLGKFPA